MSKNNITNINDLPHPDELLNDSTADSIPHPEELLKSSTLPPVTENDRAADLAAELGQMHENVGEAKNFVQSMTDPYADELAGLYADPTLGEKYRQVRDLYRHNRKKEKEDNLVSTGAGELAKVAAEQNIARGYIAPALVKSGAKLGAKVAVEKAALPAMAIAGAIRGLGESEADLTKGEYLPALQDTAMGAAIDATLTPEGLELLKKGGASAAAAANAKLLEHGIDVPKYAKQAGEYVAEKSAPFIKPTAEWLREKYGAIENAFPTTQAFRHGLQGTKATTAAEQQAISDQFINQFGEAANDINAVRKAAGQTMGEVEAQALARGLEFTPKQTIKSASKALEASPLSGKYLESAEDAQAELEALLNPRKPLSPDTKKIIADLEEQQQQYQPTSQTIKTRRDLTPEEMTEKRQLQEQARNIKRESQIAEPGDIGAKLATEDTKKGILRDIRESGMSDQDLADLHDMETNLTALKNKKLLSPEQHDILNEIQTRIREIERGKTSSVLVKSGNPERVAELERQIKFLRGEAPLPDYANIDQALSAEKTLQGLSSRLNDAVLKSEAAHDTQQVIQTAKNQLKAQREAILPAHAEASQAYKSTIDALGTMGISPGMAAQMEANPEIAHQAIKNLAIQLSASENPTVYGSGSRQILDTLTGHMKKIPVIGEELAAKTTSNLAKSADEMELVRQLTNKGSMLASGSRFASKSAHASGKALNAAPEYAATLPFGKNTGTQIANVIEQYNKQEKPTAYDLPNSFYFRFNMLTSH